jgi:branched-chain amino acid transport system permease protein
MDFIFLQEIINGVSAGLGYALIAIGFTLIFGTLRAVNFAHGEVYTIGAFAGLILAKAYAMPLVFIVAFVAVVGMIVGVALDFIAFRPLRQGRDELSIKSYALREATLLSSLALGVILREALELAFGGDKQVIPDYLLINQTIKIGALYISKGDFVILGTALSMLIGLQLFLHKTRMGLSVLAISDDQMGALYSGINTNRLIMGVFAIGSSFGAVAGILVGTFYGTIFPYMGYAPMLKALVAMLMGGLTSIPGAVICAVIVGLSESLSVEIIPSQWVGIVPYVLLLATLVFFPAGLFGRSVDRV